MYENPNFLQKKDDLLIQNDGLRDHSYITSAKDWVGGSRKLTVLLIFSTVFMVTMDTQSEILSRYYQISIPYNTSIRSAQSAKIFGIFKKNISFGVRSPCIF